MNRKSLKELKLLVQKDMEYCKSIVDNEYVKIDMNPQVIEMKIQNNARIEAMEDVLRYLENGSKYQFEKMENGAIT